MGKRIELHCHTSKDKLDAVSSPREIIKQAYDIGLSGIAITDHGSIGAFKEAEQMYRELGCDDFKLIYGVEAYIYDDEYGVIYHDKGQNLDGDYVAIDIETTGFSPRNDKIIEIAAVKFNEDGIKECFNTFVNPEIKMKDYIIELTGISNETVQKAPTIQDVLPKLMEFCGDKVIVAHNASFDMEFLREAARRMNIIWDNTVVDTYAIATIEIHDCPKYTLEAVVKNMGLKFDEDYSCLSCAKMVAEVFAKLRQSLKAHDIVCLSQIKEMAIGNVKYVKRKLTNHATILVQNQIGMENLQKIVMKSYGKYYWKKPTIPKSLLTRYREGLIIGTGCVAGELFQALVNGDTDEKIERIQQYYDYYEIQPIENNSFMIGSPRYEYVNSEEDLKVLNKKIVELGRKYNKLVIATSDVHYARKEDAGRRAKMFAERGFKNPISLDSLYLRDAEDMLGEFKYLGADVAEAVVIKNPERIAEFITDVKVDLEIRPATIADLDAITYMEAQCFPLEEAATRESFVKRLAVFPNHFWILEKDGKIICGINGITTDEETLTDEMYADVSLHDEDGAWQMIFGVTTLPEYQGNGYASMLMGHVIMECQEQGREGIVLTCKKQLISFYEKFGFVNEGESQSEHGGARWYEMRLIL